MGEAPDGIVTTGRRRAPALWIMRTPRCRPAMRTFLLTIILLAVSGSLPAQATPPSELEQAKNLLNQGHPEQAIAILQKLAAVEPPIADVEHDLGTAYFNSGQLAEARNVFAKAIEQDPADQDSVQMEG